MTIVAFNPDILNDMPPGPVKLSTSRTVWWTGRVAIGLRYVAPKRDIGLHAERMQTLLCRPQRTSIAPWRRCSFDPI
jgi:hypothetical protein